MAEADLGKVSERRGELPHPLPALVACNVTVAELELYVLDALTPAECAVVIAHLATCPSCQAQLRAILPLATALRLAVPQREPPARLRARLWTAARP